MPLANRFIVEFDDIFAALVWRAQHPLTLAAISSGAHVRKIQLEPPLYQILKLVEVEGAMRISDLRERLGVTTATASRHAATLVERGYLERADDPTDGRAVIVVLSRNGADALRRMRETWQSLLAELIGSWPERDRQQLLEGMGRLADAFAAFHEGLSAARADHE